MKRQILNSSLILNFDAYCLGTQSWEILLVKTIKLN